MATDTKDAGGSPAAAGSRSRARAGARRSAASPGSSRAKPRARRGRAPATLCIDIGGTGLKMMVLDGEGKPIAERDRVELSPREARGEKRLRFRGEGDAVGPLDVVERLDPERVARQQQPAGARVVQRDRPHAAQRVGEGGAVAAIEEERRLAVRARRESRPGERGAQLGVVVDLAIGDERGAVGLEQGLVARLQVDDREAVMRHRDVAGAIGAHAVRAAMGQRRAHGVDRALRRRLAAGGHHAGDAAHQRWPAMAARNSR